MSEEIKNEKHSKEKKSKPLLGVVSSDKMQKSRVATIERLVKHKAYSKYLKKRTKIMFHDENNESKVGDSVLIMPSKPRSSSKRFELLKVVKKSKEV